MRSHSRLWRAVVSAGLCAAPRCLGAASRGARAGRRHPGRTRGDGLPAGSAACCERSCALTLRPAERGRAPQRPSSESAASGWRPSTRGVRRVRPRQASGAFWIMKSRLHSGVTSPSWPELASSKWPVRWPSLRVTGTSVRAATSPSSAHPQEVMLAAGTSARIWGVAGRQGRGGGPGITKHPFLHNATASAPAVAQRKG